MASKKAKRWLRSIGIDVSAHAHEDVELVSFASGTGSGRYPMPFHIVKMTERTGDSKQTMGYANSLEDARAQVDAMRNNAGNDDTGRGTRGAEHMRRNLTTYYVRDIRTDETYRV